MGLVCTEGEPFPWAVVLNGAGNFGDWFLSKDVLDFCAGLDEADVVGTNEFNFPVGLSFTCPIISIIK